MAAATALATIDVNKFSAALCTTVQQIVLDRLDKAFDEKLADHRGEAKLRRIAHAQCWLTAEKIRDAVQEQCRLQFVTDQCSTNNNDHSCNGGDGNVVARSRGPSFVIGDDSSSTTSGTPSIVSSGVHSASCCSEEGVVVQVDLPDASSSSSAAVVQQPPQHEQPPHVVAGGPMDVMSGAQPLQRHLQTTTTEPPMTHDVLVLAELRQGMLKHRMLEQRCSSPTKAVELRRRHLEDQHQMECIHLLPFEHYDYSEVKDACCENVVGFIPVPTGVAGPLFFDGSLVHLPLATTEGALVASVSRGCLSINEAISVLGSDAFSVHVFRDGMSRAPVLEFPRVRDSIECLRWIQHNETFAQLKQIFEETSNYACLLRIDAHLEGTYLYLRFVATTGDAMGMNMVTKGTGRALALIKRQFPHGTLVSISGNLCVDKKPSALNWIEGRGKSVVAEALIPAPIVERVLRTSVDKMVKLGHAKLLVGSSAAVTVGGWNAHAANVVAAMFLATGQDAAQVVSSSMCLTQLQRRPEDGGALHITCTMNCLEVGTVGGGTMLTPQGACLQMLDCRRAGLRPGQNAERFARLVCAAVLAGELSLLGSQCTEGDLEKSHLRLNRSSRSLALNLAGGGGGTRSNANSPQHSVGIHHYHSSSSPFLRCSPLLSGGANNGGTSMMRDIPEHLPLSRLSTNDAYLNTERDDGTLSTTDRRNQQRQQRRGGGGGTMTSTTTSMVDGSNSSSGGSSAAARSGGKLRKIGQMCGPL